MDIDIMNYMPTGTITQNIKTGEIVHINHSAKNLLKIPIDKNDITITDLFKNKNAFDRLRTKITDDFSRIDSAIGEMFLKTLDGHFLEVVFHCAWIDRKNDLVCYVFKSTTEIIEESHINFREITEFLPSGVVVMNLEPELTIVYSNTENYEILGIHKYNEKANFSMNKIIFEEDAEWVTNEIIQNLQTGKDVDVEFRIKTDTSELKWIRLCGRAKQSNFGNKLFYCTLKDLSMWREINSKTHIETVMMRKVAELSNELIFRVDLETDIIYFIGNRAVHGGRDTAENFPQGLIDMGLIYEEDIETFRELAQDFRAGIYKHVEIRHKTPDGSFEWFKVIYNFVNDSENKPLLVTGKLANIHEQKILEEQAKTDLLTGLLNKITTENEINKIFFLEDDLEVSHTLIIIDIDFFKSINDNLGHHFGDKVLNEIAKDIKSCFRKTDIMGRIGGDEFIVLMKNIDHKKDAMQRIETISEHLRKTYEGRENKYSISASIGVTTYPKDGDTYEELYKKADIALYKTKENGKDGFTEYSDRLIEEDRRINTETDRGIHNTKRHKHDLIDISVITTVFNLLYETKDINMSLISIMEYLGKHYKIHRCYIFETHDGGLTYQNHYQWFDRSFFSKNGQGLQSVDRNIIDAIFDGATEDGIYYTDDIHSVHNKEAIDLLEGDNVVSILLVDSMKENHEKALFGMENCFENREWTEQEVQTVFQVARLIFSILNCHNINNSLKSYIKQLEGK